MITLITPTQGNPIALKRTLESFKDVCDEFIIGDGCIFESDSKIIQSYKKDFNIGIVDLPFNYIFTFGFSSALNLLAAHSSNDLVVYMNVGEIIGEEHAILPLLKHFTQFNCYPFDHATDPHTWFRCYNRKELQWGGMIHEELTGNKREAPFYLFRMADTPKDDMDKFYAKVMDDAKELVYFNQYKKLVENPELKSSTNEYWLKFAKENYQSMIERLAKKGNRYEAYLNGNLQQYLDDVNTNTEFESLKFESSTLIDFQTNKTTLL